jgi:hypothetical protein
VGRLPIETHQPNDAIMTFWKQICLASTLMTLCCGVANAQEPIEPGSAPLAPATIGRGAIRFDAGPSPSLERRATAQELIQARAMERERQRVARIEANAWAGYDPGRPTLAANPFTQMHAPVYRPYFTWHIYSIARIGY